MLLSGFNFCHDHVLAPVCWTFLSFLGTFEKKRNGARLSALVEFVPPPAVVTQHADHSASKPPDPPGRLTV